MKAVEKTKSRQKDSTHRSLSGEPATEAAIARLNEILTKALAAYVLLRSKELPSKVINDLCRIEIEAAQLIQSFYTNNRKINLKGSLASVISFIPNSNNQKASTELKKSTHQALKKIPKNRL